MSDDPRFEAMAPEFAGFFPGNSSLKQLATGFDWTEGPVWFGDAGCLLFSDIPNDRIVRWNAETGVSTYRSPANYTNGHTRDRQGRLVSCEHGGRRVTRTEHDGSLTVIADQYQGKRLNSPNDVVVKSDDSIWFTDPHYGIMTNYEGYESAQELPCYVYRVDPSTGEMTAVATDFSCPNGLAFNSDESRLYVSDTGAMLEADPDRHIRVFSVHNDKLGDSQVFHRIAPGASDGIRIDSDDNLWSSAGDGVHCLNSAGDLLGKIRVPEVVSNLCFGGRSKHQLFITASTSIYAIRLHRRGIQQP